MVKVGGYASKGGKHFMIGFISPMIKGLVAPKGDNYFLVALPVVYTMPTIVHNMESCIGVLGIHDICHFTSRDIGYYPFYFYGYGILCSIFSIGYFQGY